MPITRGSTPATALPTNAPSGSTPSSRAFSSDAITSAAAPSLMPGRVAGRDRAALAERRLQRRELLGVVSGRGCSSRVDVADRRRARRRSGPPRRRRPAPLRRERERVLVLARDAPPLGHVLARLAHRLEREHRLHPRIREAPAERRVVHGRRCRAGTPCPASPSTSGARRHRLDAAGDEEVAVARDDGVARPTTAESPDAQSRLTVTPATDSRQPREQRRHPRDVAVVLARLVRAAEADVLDLLGRRRRSARRPPRSRPPRGRRAARPRARRRSGRSACAPRERRPRAALSDE